MPTNRCAADGIKVGIIGGSIAGCAAAIELMRAGCDVSVYERSHAHLEDRGAGIASATAFLEMLQSRDLLDMDMPWVTINKRPLHVRSDDAPYIGRLIWEQPMLARAMNWGVLFHNLRKRLPDAMYHQGYSATTMQQTEDRKVVIQFANGEEARFDLVLFADGYNSQGRRWLFLHAELEYAGYVLWRGPIDENDIQLADYLQENLTAWGMHDGGHCVSYMVPGQHGEISPGQRRLNWAWYRSASSEELPQLLTDTEGHIHDTSLPQGAMPAERVVSLQDAARSLLPGFMADVICATLEPYIQGVYDMHVPSYLQGHVCLLGDASSLARPHTGAGAFKAISQALALADALKEDSSLDEALHAWNEEVHTAGEQQVELGKTLGRATVLETPPWSRMDQADAERWWASATRGHYVYYIDDAQEKRT